MSAAALALAIALPAAASTADCTGCHGEPSLSTKRGSRTVSLYVNPTKYSRSVHASLDCADCHSGFDPANLPHQSKIEPVRCTRCHEGVGEQHAFHQGMARVDGTETDPAHACKGCHGSHEVAKAVGEGGRFERSRLVTSCGACHGDIALRFVDSSHGKAVAAGTTGAPDCLTCHTKPITASREGDLLEMLVAQDQLCLSCHVDDPAVRERMGPSAGFVAAYEKSVHGSAIQHGNPGAATCVRCHGAHEMRTGMDPLSRVSKARIPETCAQCHGEIALEYWQSIHGQAVKRGVSESPVCTDCHGEHDIYPRDDPRSPVAPANVSARVCTPCHASLKLVAKYDVADDRANSFADSYHGLALRAGQAEVANCASCHGSHGIKPSGDPTSKIHKSNLAATCGHCHPGATERFAEGSVHLVMTAEQEPTLFWIATLYIGMIAGTIGGMFFHNGLDFYRKVRHELHAHRHGRYEDPLPHSLYLRMSVSERIQHAALALSFIVLALTGFMLRYPEAWWVVGLRRVSGSLFAYRAAIHRTAAVVMVLASLYHIGYVAISTRGRQLIRDLVPTPQDLRDVVRALAYYVGVSKQRPRFGRFGYIEKAEYWALIWGTIVMAVTGAILWFDNTFMNVLTKLGSDIARTIHFYEAVLATLAILVWHIYFVVINPDVYPMSFAWLTGMITEREMAEEHGLELEAIRRRRSEEEAAANNGADGSSSAEGAASTAT